MFVRLPLMLRICFDFNPLHNLFLCIWKQCSGNNSVDNFLYSHSPFNASLALLRVCLYLFAHFSSFYSTSAVATAASTLFYRKLLQLHFVICKAINTVEIGNCSAAAVTRMKASKIGLEDNRIFNVFICYIYDLQEMPRIV